MAKTKLPQLGIDPGVSGGGISVLNNGKLYNFKMPEKFREIKEILKPYGGAPNDALVRCSIEQLSMRPGQSSFITARMQPMLRNYDRVKDALIECNIPFQEVAPVQWQKFHNLILPKGTGEKGLDPQELVTLKKDLKHLQIHRSIESNTPNDVVYTDDVMYILETSGKEAARKMLMDDFAHFTKYDLQKAIDETEHSITKWKAKEKTLRKKRYQTYITEVLSREGYNEKIPLWKTDSLCILLYQIHN